MRSKKNPLSLKWSFSEIIYLCSCKIYTTLFFRKSRLIRFPIDVRRKGCIDFGKRLTTGKYCRIESFSINGEKTLFFGNNVQINDFVHVSSLKNVEIGNNVLIASKVFISDLEHGSYNGDEHDSHPCSVVKDRTLSSKPVKICDNVWIGELVSILPGTTIGENSIIGANSVVTKSIPANSIAVGNPAKVIKQFNFSTNRWERV